MMDAHIQFDGFILLGVVDGIYPAEFGTDFTSAGFEVHAHVPVNGRRIGNGLGIGHIDRFAAPQAHVVFRWNDFDGMPGDVLQA